MASRFGSLLGLIVLAGFTGIASDLIWATRAGAQCSRERIALAVPACKAAIVEACDCRAFARHRGFVKCAKAAARAALRADFPGCVSDVLPTVMECASKSLCGLDEGRVICCRRHNGHTEGVIVSDASTCEGDAACVASPAYTDCCSACIEGTAETESACAAPPPGQGVCGNGIVETGYTDGRPDEQCDDGNLIANDGCSPTCTIELCPSCDGVCVSTCVTCPQTVTFTDINDAVPGRFFNAALSIPDAADPNTLVLGLDTGLAPFPISKFRNFRASLLAFSYPEAADTIGFVITAPCGYTVETVTYTQQLVLNSSRTGRSFGTTQLVVNGIATNVAIPPLPVLITAPPQQEAISLTGLKVTRVPMSITTSLVAANATAELLSGRVTVQVVPVPVVPVVTLAP